MSELSMQRLQRRRLALLHRRIIFGVPVLVLLSGLGLTVFAAHPKGRACDGPRGQAYEVAKSARIFELQTGSPLQHLDELVDPPSSHEPIMEELPLDPWGHAYAFFNPGLRNTRGVDVVSAGEDGVFFTADDLGNWTP